MNANPMQLYAQMQDEITQLNSSCKNEIILIENCFNTALVYWNIIKKSTAHNLFNCEREEINFYKHIKPLFLAVIEYYTFCYQAVLFKPYTDKDELILFWLHQLKKVDSFFNRHKEFYHYYLGGQTDKDKIYFTLEADATIKNSYAATAARILGYRQYVQYVETELETLTTKYHKEQQPIQQVIITV